VRQQALAQCGRLLGVLGLEEMADLGPRTTALHVGEPGRVGVGIDRGDDLDTIAIR